MGIADRRRPVRAEGATVRARYTIRFEGAVGGRRGFGRSPHRAALGLAPVALISDVRFQIAGIALGTVVLVYCWRGLITETAVGYAQWYEDIDGRSSLFLIGAAMLTIAAGALFPRQHG